MKLYTLLFGLLPFFSFSQVKTIANSELTIGSGIFFSAEMNNTTGIVKVILSGPTDRYFSIGFGNASGMGSGDALIYSNASGSTTLKEHNLGGFSTPALDASNEWTLNADSLGGGLRYLKLSRTFAAVDATDFDFAFAQTSLNLFWAKSGGASFSITNHGGANRATGIVKNWVLDTPPTLSSSIPADNATVNNATSLSLTFNENIVAGTGNITVFDATNVAVQTINISSATISGTNCLINFPALTAGSYYVHVANTAIKDANSNAYAGISNSTSLNFIVDNIAPTANTLTPLDDAISVPLANNLSITFSEPVTLTAGGNLSLFKSDGTLVQAFTSTNLGSSLTITGNTLNINPTLSLLNFQGYYVTITSNFIKDAASNFYTGITPVTSWNFTTGDFILPTLSTLIPADNATNVSISNDLSITFSENIQINSGGTIELYLVGTGLVETFTNATATISNATITLNPSVNLTSSGNYYVNIPATSLSDLNGNNFAGITDQTTWNFITVDNVLPLVTTLVPADNTTGVSISNNLTITFSENIQFNPGGTIELYLVGTGLVETFTSATATISSATITINPAANLISSSSYYLNIPATSIADLSGNNFAGITDLTTWNFTTGDFTAPTLLVNSFLPADNAVGVALTNLDFECDASESIVLNPTGTIQLNTAGNVVATLTGADLIVVNNNQIQGNFPIALLSNTLYYFTISNNLIIDLAGNNYTGTTDPTFWNFTTLNNAGIEEVLPKSVLLYPDFIERVDGNVGFTMFASSGQIVKVSNEKSMSFTGLEKGIYFIQLNESETKVKVYVH